MRRVERRRRVQQDVTPRLLVHLVDVPRQDGLVRKTAHVLFFEFLIDPEPRASEATRSGQRVFDIGEVVPQNVVVKGSGHVDTVELAVLTDDESSELCSLRKYLSVSEQVLFGSHDSGTPLM